MSSGQHNPGSRNGASGGRVHQAKLVLLGDQSVGKSSIGMRFVRGQFRENSEATVGAAFLTQTVQTQGQTVKFDIWDTAGQERYHSLAPMYYRGAQASVVVYDVNKAETFNRAIAWVRELREQVSDEIIIILAGNKVDLAAEHRAVPVEDGRALAEENGLIFAEVSAKTGLAINEMFTMIANKLINKASGGAEGRGVRLKEGEKSSSGCKC